jgi:hypothetical protein
MFILIEKYFQHRMLIMNLLLYQFIRVFFILLICSPILKGERILLFEYLTNYINLIAHFF